MNAYTTIVLMEQEHKYKTFFSIRDSSCPDVNFLVSRDVTINMQDINVMLVEELRPQDKRRRTPRRNEDG